MPDSYPIMQNGLFWQIDLVRVSWAAVCILLWPLKNNQKRTVEPDTPPDLVGFGLSFPVPFRIVITQCRFDSVLQTAVEGCVDA